MVKQILEEMKNTNKLNRAIEEVIRIIFPYLLEDPFVKNKIKFVEIFSEILAGKSLEGIALEYKISPKTIIGVRRRFLEYQKNAIAHSKKNSKDTITRKLSRALAETKYYDTFSPNWVPKDLRGHVVERAEFKSPDKRLIKKGIEVERATTIGLHHLK